MTAKPMVVVVGADKGGVGKTTVSRALLAYFEAHGIEFKAWDTEPAPGVLKRFHSAQTEIVDLTRSDGQMAVFDNLSKAYVTVIDLKAGLMTENVQMLTDIGFIDLAREGKIELVFLHVMGATQASFDEIKAIAAKLSGVKHFLVTNHINDTEFWGWDSPEAKATLALASSGTIDIPKLDELAMETVGVKSVGFNQFHSNPENSFVIRGKVRHWLGQVFTVLNGAKLDPNG